MDVAMGTADDRLLAIVQKHMEEPPPLHAEDQYQEEDRQQ